MPDSATTLILVIGGFGVLIIPVAAGIAWSSARNIVKAVNALTVTVAKIEVKLDVVTNKDLPRLREDMRSWSTARRKNNDKDRILED